MKSPFKFLDPYTPKDKQVFFGRDREIEELYQKLMMTSMLLVYGLSGAGKTSLVRCGLAKRFRGPDWYPLYIRRGEDINQAVYQALQEKAGVVDDEHYKADLEKVYEELSKAEEGAVAQIAEPQRALSGNLAAAIDQLYARHLRPIYLIFDQFEEIFTLGTEDEQRIFAESLRDLIHGDQPCKIILVMREEYIGYLYYFEEVLPEINDFRIRVETMEDKRIAEVIRKSCPPFNIKLEDDQQIPSLIIDKLRGDETGNKGLRTHIQLPYLQVYLDGLYQQVLRESYPAVSKLDELPAPLPQITFSAQAVENYGSIENVLGDFLDSQVKQIQATIQTAFPLSRKDAVEKVLDQFVTLDGTKRPFFKAEINVPNLKPEVSNAIVDELLQARILRPDGDRFELAHDALAFRIDAQRTSDDRRIKEAKEMLKTKYKRREHTGRLSAQEVAFVRSVPQPKERIVEDKELGRSVWTYFRGSENRVLLQRFSWVLGLLLLLAAIGIGEGFIIWEQKETIAEWKSFGQNSVEAVRHYNSMSQVRVEGTTINRLDTLISQDSIPEADTLITGILVTLGGLPLPEPPIDTPINDSLPCDSLMRQVKEALNSLNALDSKGSLDNEAWMAEHCDPVFEKFQLAFQEGGSCSGSEKAEDLQEEIGKKANAYLEEALALQGISDSVQVIKELLQKAYCLDPYVETKKLIEGL